MAKKKSIKKDNRAGLDVKVRANYVYVLILGILLFAISAFFDKSISATFDDVNIPFIGWILGIITNFSVVVFIFLVIPIFMLYKKDRRAAYLLMLSFALAFIISFVIKLIFIRDRPIEPFEFPLLSIINYSFPSMHAMVVFALLPLLATFMPKQKAFWSVLAFLVAFSRIYFNFHFLSDVVFGIFAGYFIGEFLLYTKEKGILWKN